MSPTSRHRFRINLWSHVALVLSFVLIPIATSPDFNWSLDLFKIRPFQKDFTRHLLLPVFFYLHHYVFYSKSYERRQFLKYFILIFLSYTSIVFLPNVIFGFGRGHGHVNPPGLLQEILRPLFPFIVVWIGSFYIHLQKRANDYKLDKINAELESLKYQLNPHFLFNTLNAIYALALTKSDKAAKSILKLSGILRYVYSDSANETVSLVSELDYVKDYIDIMSLKTDSSLKITCRFTGTFEGLFIAPMILINFVENAFKYGYDPDSEGHINISVEIESGHVLHMKIENKILRNISGESPSTKFGDTSTLKRLNYLYPDRHKLTVTENDDVYKVDLRIWLN